jgi:hypothetical protein
MPKPWVPLRRYQLIAVDRVEDMREWLEKKNFVLFALFSMN